MTINTENNNESIQVQQVDLKEEHFLNEELIMNNDSIKLPPLLGKCSANIDDFIPN
ncbi:MAG: hypothetical protein AABY27_00650 [Pseudomonadota bacterium]